MQQGGRTQREYKSGEIMCTGCGAPMGVGQTVCGACGRDLRKVEELRKTGINCPRCGALNSLDAKICIGCERELQPKKTKGEFLDKVKAEEAKVGLLKDINCPSCGTLVKAGGAVCPGCGETDFGL